MADSANGSISISESAASACNSGSGYGSRTGSGYGLGAANSSLESHFYFRNYIWQAFESDFHFNDK
jgi:hypothetical protein